MENTTSTPWTWNKFNGYGQKDVNENSFYELHLTKILSICVTKKNLCDGASGVLKIVLMRHAVKKVVV